MFINKWNISIKEWNNAICSNTNGLNIIKWSQRKANMIYYHLHGESKKWYKWTNLQNRNRLADVENKLMVTKWKRGWRNGVWGLPWWPSGWESANAGGMGSIPDPGRSYIPWDMHHNYWACALEPTSYN